MDKAPEAFRTISEVADELEVPKHVLRFWEAKFAHLKPMKRGGGRRYYRPEDVALLREEAPEGLAVKASGGIRTLDDALDMLNAGASRLGTSGRSSSG